MNSDDVLKYGHGEVVAAIEDVPEAEWYRPGVCGVWSVKEIIAHLASYELLLVDALNSVLDETRPTPTLDTVFELDGLEQFNDVEVAARQKKSMEEVLAEYTNTYRQAEKLLAQIPIERRRQAGVLAWYGDEYDLEDFIAYSFYGHKREHSAQINVFKDLLIREQSS